LIVYVKLWYPDDLDASPQVHGVYKTRPSEGSNELVEAFELEENEE
jgi:hypothetical protein